MQISFHGNGISTVILGVCFAPKCNMHPNFLASTPDFPTSMFEAWFNVSISLVYLLVPSSAALAMPLHQHLLL